MLENPVNSCGRGVKKMLSGVKAFLVKTSLSEIATIVAISDRSNILIRCYDILNVW